MAGRVRQPVDEAALGRYLGDRLPQVKAPISIQQFGFGQSNPTYLLTGADGQRFVLRKPPGTLLSKTAHRVEREYRIMKALGPTAVPVPTTHWLCETQVVGTAFYVMAYLDGRIFEEASMPTAASATERGQLWRAAIEALARLHIVDVAAVGLADFGKPAGLYGRQLRTWAAIGARQEAVVDVRSGERVGRLPHWDDLLAFFADEARRPRNRATLVHGDIKIDNIVFAKREARVLGILDWEMSTVGHPLSDVCNILTPLYTARDSSTGLPAAPGFLAGQTAGLPTTAQILAWYRAASGYDPSADLAWGMAFSMFKLAAMCQGIAARVALSQATSEQARRYADRRATLADFAWTLARRAAGGAEEEAERPTRPTRPTGAGGGSRL